MVGAILVGVNVTKAKQRANVSGAFVAVRKKCLTFEANVVEVVFIGAIVAGVTVAGANVVPVCTFRPLHQMSS